MAEQNAVQIEEAFSRDDKTYFQGAHVYTQPGGWLRGTRTDILLGDGINGLRAMVVEGEDLAPLPFRVLSDRKTPAVDVAVFPPNSSKRAYSALVRSQFGPLPLPFYEGWVKHALSKAQKRAGRLAMTITTTAEA
jgi:hypothetical protein